MDSIKLVQTMLATTVYDKTQISVYSLSSVNGHVLRKKELEKKRNTHSCLVTVKSLLIYNNTT